MTIVSILEWFETTALSLYIRESLYGFAIFITIHIFGIALSVGMLLWADLRMLGVAMRRASLSEIYRGLLPWFVVGFAVMLASGASLFMAYATSVYVNEFFRIKMAAIALAAVNALIFHVATRRSRADEEVALPPSGPTRFAGFLSIVLWAIVILCGRAMSYTVF